MGIRLYAYLFQNIRVGAEENLETSTKVVPSGIRSKNLEGEMHCRRTDLATHKPSAKTTQY
jgi:hypothetical protein